MIRYNFSVSPEHDGLPFVFFPDYRPVREPLSPFVRGDKLLVFSNVQVDPYPDKDVIQISNSGKPLHSRSTIKDLIQDTGFRLSKVEQDYLDQVEDERFYEIVKILFVTGFFPMEVVEGQTTSFQLFQSLFEAFGDSYRIYRKTGSSHRVLISALLTMMLKTKDCDNPMLSYSYKKALMKNKPYFSVFQKSLMGYIQSNMEEKDFVSFLQECSQR